MDNENNVGCLIGAAFVFGTFLYSGRSLLIEKTKLADYTITCSMPFQKGECHGKVRPGQVAYYKINHLNNEVVAKVDEPNPSIRKLTNCTIYDVDNWHCPSLFSTFGDGYPDYEYGTRGAVKHVGAWKHWLHRVLVWTGLSEFVDAFTETP